MGLSGQIRAGGAFVELSLQDNKFVSGLRAAQNQLKSAAGVMTGIGGAIAGGAATVTAGVGAMIARFAQVGGDIDDMSQRTGVAVEELSSLSYATKMTGSNSEDLEKALRKMQVKLAAVSEGSASAASALDAISVSYSDLKGKTPDEQFRLIADGISKIEDPAKKSAAAMEIFGKSGANLVPLMNGGADGIRALEEEARGLGLVMSTKDAQAAAVLGDAMDKLWMILGRVSDKVAGALAPALINAIDWVVTFSGALMTFIDENQDTIRIVAAVVLGLLALGGVLIAGGAAFWTLSAAVGVMAGIFTGLGTLVATVAGGIATAIAFITSPFTLVVAAVVAFGVAVLYYTGVAGAAWDWLSKKAGDLLGDVMKVFNAVQEAFMAGDLALAAQLLWTGVELVWLKATGGIMTHLTSWWNTLRSLWADGWSGLVAVMTAVGANMQQLWADITHGIYDRWNWTVGKVSEGLIRAAATAQGLSAEETQAWVDESNAMTDQAATESASNYARTTSEIGKNLAKSLDDIETQRQSTKARIASDEKTQLSAAEQRVKDLQAQFDAMSSPKVGPEQEAAQAGPLAAAMTGVPAAAMGVSAASTFRAAEVSGLAAGSPVERILKESLTAQQQTADNTKNSGKVKR